MSDTLFFHTVRKYIDLASTPFTLHYILSADEAKYPLFGWTQSPGGRHYERSSLRGVRTHTAWLESECTGDCATRTLSSRW